VRRKSWALAGGLAVIVGALVAVKLLGAPSGATQLQLASQPGLPMPGLGCANAPVGPIRVEDTGSVARFRMVPTDELLELVWPPGYTAWLATGGAVVLNGTRDLVFREGQILENLGGTPQDDGSWRICISFDWVPEIRT
jgi:hypothetical protein